MAIAEGNTAGPGDVHRAAIADVSRILIELTIGEGRCAALVDIGTAAIVTGTAVNFGISDGRAAIVDYYPSASLDLRPLKTIWAGVAMGNHKTIEYGRGVCAVTRNDMMAVIAKITPDRVAVYKA